MTDILTVVRVLTTLLLIALFVILVTRRLAIPYTLGLVVVGLVIGLLQWFPSLRLTPDLVLFVFLPPLLFEGSWSLSVRILLQNWLTILLLVVPGVLLEVVLIAAPLYLLAHLDVPTSLLLAAILTPTDPVAVLGTFRQLHVNKRLSTIIEGESLFNDGMAGVLYHVLLTLEILSLHGGVTTGTGIWLNGIGTFVLEAGGGTLIGLACGFLISRFVRYLDDPLIETLLTIVTAYGVYLLADALHTSGILAVILAGLIVGSYGQAHGMSERTAEFVDNFWGVIAFIANALIFLLVGVQLNPQQFLSYTGALNLALGASIAVAAVLLARLLMIVLLPRHQRQGVPERSWRFVIFWSGMRGALSLALVLALPQEIPHRDLLILSTYAVVLFTLIVQGFSLRALLKRLPRVAD